MITHVAVKRFGVVYSLPKPNRHHHILHMLYDLGITQAKIREDEIQGFMTDSGEFLDRKKAIVYAKKMWSN